MKRKNTLRRVIQLLSTAGLIVLFLRQDYSQANQPFFTWAGWLDPIQGIGAFLKGHWPYFILLSLGATVLALFFSRFFCGWLCPVGAILDLIGSFKKLVRWPNKKLSPATRRILEILRWVICGCVIGLVGAGFLIATVFNPFVILPREIYRSLNGFVPWSIGFLVIAGFGLFPRFWCRFLCPTGSLLHLANRIRGRCFSATSACKQCGSCIRHCSMANITVQAKSRDASQDASGVRFGYDCLQCGECVRSCPLTCVSKTKRNQADLNEGRRDFITAAGFGIGTLGLALWGRNVSLATGAPVRHWSRLLRPPGALAEESLKTTCNRCGQCLQVCPTKVLIPAGLESGIEGLWTPRFVPCRGPVPGRCMFCMACAQVCPTRALAPVAPETVRLGTAVIDHSTCLAWANGTQCLLCVETCPRFAIQLDSSRRHPVIDQRLCNGCGSCEAHCPVSGSAVKLNNQGETRRRQ